MAARGWLEEPQPRAPASPPDATLRLKYATRQYWHSIVAYSVAGMQFPDNFLMMVGKEGGSMAIRLGCSDEYADFVLADKAQVTLSDSSTPYLPDSA